jgi:deoxyhypusine monooxygenase
MKTDSALLKHEIAYCIGQLEDKHAIPFLSSVLEDKSENSMVRHEAGEALGAIGEEDALELLKKHRDDLTNPVEVKNNLKKILIC